MRRDATDIITTNKILHGNIDIEPSSVGRPIMTSTLPTRSNGTNLTVTKARTNFIKKKSYSFSIQFKWNSLPTNIKNTKSLSLCKSQTIGLSKLGNIDQPLMWIKDFLCNRYLRVVYKDSVSTPARVLSGFLQGPAISSLLFKVYISDLAEVVDLCDLILFADDSKAVGPLARKHDRIQLDHNNIGAWSEKNHLPLCIDKCVAFHFIWSA